MIEYGTEYPDTDAWADEDGAVRGTGAAVLDEVRAYITRFVALPSEAAEVAATLWAAHSHVLEAAESTPRLAALSPEPESGKTRLLEVLAHLVPHPMHAINATPAALFRAVKDLQNRPTILYDEIDTVFGPKAKENEEVRGLLNAGHRRGAVAYRCVGEGTRQKVEAFPAYAALALAGLGDLPDTLMSRSVIIRMRRRSPSEPVEPYRERIHGPQGDTLADQLADWTANVADQLHNAWPTLPEGISDRPADVWEPLLAIAEAAGGHWPEQARAACVELVAAAQTTASGSLGIKLLEDLRAVFGDADALPTETILERLRDLDESPWADLRGKALDARGLARRLRPYGITSRNVRAGSRIPKGYLREDLHDVWQRYLSASPDSPLQALQGQHPRSEAREGVADNEAAALHRYASATGHDAVTSTVAHVADVADPSQRGGETNGAAYCTGCGQQLLLPGRNRCEACRRADQQQESVS